MMRMLVRGLDGRTSCLHFPSSSLPGFLLLHRISSLFHIPPPLLRVVTGTREITPHISLCPDPCGFLPSCTLLLRLPGGKGGFGSLLRGAATKAGQKKTSNFDACRDMSGRRLRHVNAEKKLKEWKAQAKDRELERTANEFLKKQIKRKEDESGCSKEIEKYREETSRAMEDVESAVARGLVEAKRFGKRKIIEETPTSSKRRACSWVADEDIENEDTITVKMSHMKKSHVHVECIDAPKIEEQFDICSVEDSGLNKSAHVFEDLDKGNSKSNLGSHAKESHVLAKSIDVRKIAAVDHNVREHHIQSHTCSMQNSILTKSAHGLEVIENDNTKSGCDDIVGGLKSNSPALAYGDRNRDSDGVENESATTVNVGKIPYGQLNFDDFQTAADMEVLGLERLKCELQTRGLKCGGNLAERAARFFLLKNTPLEKLDKKHFAKIKGGNK